MQKWSKRDFTKKNKGQDTSEDQFLFMIGG
jgi:hypothetical protein